MKGAVEGQLDPRAEGVESSKCKGWPLKDQLQISLLPPACPAAACMGENLLLVASLEHESNKAPALLVRCPRLRIKQDRRTYHEVDGQDGSTAQEGQDGEELHSCTEDQQ